MKTALLAAVLVLTAAIADARSGGLSGGRGGARGFSRSLSHPSFARSNARSSFAPKSFGSQRSTFGTAAKRSVSGAPTAPTGGGKGGSSTQSAPAVSGAAVPGAKILTAGQQPVYSAAAGGGTNTVEGGAITGNANAQNVGVGGVTWSAPDKQPSTGSSGSGGTGVSANPGF
jgi:hypothetical protein